VSVTQDLVVQSIQIHYTRMTGKSVSGSVVFQTAGTINLTNVNIDISFPSQTSASAVMSGQFTLNNSDVLTQINFTMSGTASYASGSKTITWQFQISGSRNLNAGTYVVLVRSDYSIGTVTVNAP
jgi:hypothetical protein